jgi:hypothetical protein
MTGEQIRRRGLVHAALGVVLVAWVVVFAATTETGTPLVLVAAAVSAGLVCLCPVAAGLVATRITGVASAARMRHVFVVLAGTGLTAFYPYYWSAFNVEPVGVPGGVALGVGLMLAVPIVLALVLTVSISQSVDKFVINADGPLVTDSGDGAPAQRIRVLGSVLVTAGFALAVAAAAVALTAPKYQGIYLFSGLVVTFTPVVLGVLLARTTDVHSARRRNSGPYVVILTAFTTPLAAFGFEAGVSAVLLAVVMFGAMVLVVIALLMLREYTGAVDRPWRERLWGRTGR